MSPNPTVMLNGVAADLSSETLVRADGRQVAIRPQAFAALRHLIANPNRLVSKAELMQVVWRGAAVTDDSLVQCVLEIRRALDDRRRDVLQTVSRRGYRLVLPEAGAAPPSQGPSIAVLPFENLSDVAADAYFADGLVEDVITSLSRIRGLFVIARNSSFAYRGTGTGARTIADELGVRYLVEGSVRRSGERLRLNARLVDRESASPVWAGKFDGVVGDVFDLQDDLTEQIVGVIEPSVRRAEIERARRKRREALDAYDLFLRALPYAVSNTVADTERALRLLDEALQRDPDHLPAHGYAAWCHEQRYFRGGFDPADRAKALAHADAVTGPNCDDPQAMSIGAFVRAILTRDYDAAEGVLDRALALNPNSALAYGFSALIAAHNEREARAIEHASRALRLSPIDDPLSYHPYCALALTSLFAGRFAEAVAYCNLSIVANAGFSVVHAYLVAGYVGLGEIEAARAAGRRLIELAPGFTIDGFARMNVFRAPVTAGLAGALRVAGLPEG